MYIHRLQQGGGLTDASPILGKHPPVLHKAYILQHLIKHKS